MSQRFKTPLTSFIAKSKPFADGQIATAVDKTLQDLLLQRIQTGVAQGLADPPHAFDKDRVVLSH